VTKPNPEDFGLTQGHVDRLYETATNVAHLRYKSDVRTLWIYRIVAIISVIAAFAYQDGMIIGIVLFLVGLSAKYLFSSINRYDKKYSIDKTLIGMLSGDVFSKMFRYVKACGGDVKDYEYLYEAIKEKKKEHDS